MKRLVYTDNNFTSFELKPDKSIFASHIYIATKGEREILAESIFEFIDNVYDEMGGFKSFKDIDAFIDNSYLWYITYDGEQPKTLDEFDIGRVLVISVFRQNHGLKMVGLARRKIGPHENNKEENYELRRNANSAVYEHIKFIIKRGWAEIGGTLQFMFNRVCNLTDIIDPYDLIKYKIFSNVEIIDEFSYTRPIRKGEKPVEKIAYGTIKLA